MVTMLSSSGFYQINNPKLFLKNTAKPSSDNELR